MDGLKAWLPKEDCAPLFGLDRSIDAIRFSGPLPKESKLKILWWNIRRCFIQRWKYYD